MKKRNVVLLLSSMMLVSACGNNAPKHNFADVWESNATSHWHACLDDGCTEKNGEAQHTFGSWQTVSAATFDAAGSEKRTCSVCEYIETRPISKLEHNYSSDWSKDNDKHWHACTDSGYTNLKKDEAAHTAGEWITDQDSTFDAVGSKHKECTVCHQTLQTETIEKKTHSYSNDWSNDADKHWHACTDSGHTDLKKDEAAHTAGEWIVDQPATFSSDGSKHKECSVCGYTLETQSIAKKTVSWTGVSIEQQDNNVNFVISGSSTGCTSGGEILAAVQFKLKLSGSDVKRSQNDLTAASFDSATGNFVLKTDVTDLDFATNPPYYSNIGVGSIADFKPADGIVAESTIKLNGKTYDLFYAKGSGEKIDGYGCVSLRVSETVNTTFTATGAHLESTDSAVYYIVTGTSTGFASREELADALLFQLKTSGANVKRQASDADVTLDTSTGDFSLKFDVTNLNNATNPPYYTNIGITGPGIADFKPEDETKVATETIKLNGKQYELRYAKGSKSSADGYGCVSIVVSDAGALSLTPNSASLEVIDDNVYYVVTGTSTNFVSQAEFEENIVLEIRSSGSVVNAGTEKEGCIYVFNAATGEFTLKVKITDVAVRANPYYSRFSLKGVYVTGTQYPNFDTVASENVVRTPVTLGEKTYEIVFDKTQNTATYGYATISLKVSAAE